MENAIKSALRFHLTPVRIAIIQKKKKNEEDVGEKEHLQPIGKNVNYCSHSGNQYESSSEN
jgi:hypothetical protein